jgi:glycogen(starch) synthase
MAETTQRDVNNHVLFEIATEVANRGMRLLPQWSATMTANISAVGGIYSVLKSKAQVTTAEYGSAYTLLGPLNRKSVS